MLFPAQEASAALASQPAKALLQPVLPKPAVLLLTYQRNPGLLFQVTLGEVNPLVTHSSVSLPPL